MSLETEKNKKKDSNQSNKNVSDSNVVDLSEKDFDRKSFLSNIALTTRILKKEKLEHKVPKPDCGYAWFIAFLSFMFHFAYLGFMYVLTFVLGEIQLEFNISNSETAWIIGFLQCTLLLVGPFAGRIVEKVGFRLPMLVAGVLYCLLLFTASYVTAAWQLYILFGLMGAFMGTGFVVAIQSVLAWFDKRRALGVGIGVAGSGLGNFALAPIMQALIDAGGWRSALRWFALFTLVVSLLNAAFVRRRAAKHVSKGKNEDAAQRRLLWSHVCSRNFVFMSIGSVFVSCAYFTPFLFLKPYAASVGIEKTQIVWLISGLGISSTVGRFGMGWLADYVGRLLILRVSFFAMAACMLIVAFLESLVLLWLFVIVFGAMAGSFISLLSPVCSELFPTLLLPTLTAGVYAGGALGNLFGSPLSGAIIDSAGGYFAAFIVSGVLMIVAGVSLLFVRIPDIHPDIVALSVGEIGVIDEEFFSFSETSTEV